MYKDSRNSVVPLTMFTVQVMSSLKVEMAFKDKVELKEKIEPK